MDAPPAMAAVSHRAAPRAGRGQVDARALARHGLIPPRSRSVIRWQVNASHGGLHHGADPCRVHGVEAPPRIGERVAVDALETLAHQI